MTDQPPRVLFAQAFRANLKDLPDKVLRSLFDNLIDPLQKGYAISELQGKYKPSWELSPNCTELMRHALAKFAQEQSLFHYHFGYPLYRTGRDPKYAGDESEGIVHTVIKIIGDRDQHILFRVDESHPTPFNIPTDLRL